MEVGTTTLRKELLCEVLDDLAVRDPDRLFCIHPICSDILQGWRKITMKDMAAAVNYAAHWIVKTVDLGSESECLTYIGANDVRYAALSIACMKIGHSVLLLSPRNSVPGSLHVLHETKSSKLIFSGERQKVVEELQRADGSLQLWEIPDLWEMFNRKADHYPCKRRYIDVEDQPAVVIHSSGTTGYPKPVPLTNGYFSVFDNISKLPHPAGRLGSLMSTVKPGALLFATAPFFHILGYGSFLESVFNGTPFVLGPDKPITLELLTQIYEATHPANAMMTPSIIESLSASQAGPNFLKQFKTVFFGGAALSSEVGNKLCRHVHLQTLIGSSEAGIIPSLAPADTKDWEWFDWNPYNDVEMQTVGDGLFEMVLRRKETRDFSCIFHTYPDIDQYHTKDLFTQHPTKPNLWRYHCRFDDVIVLSNGEKFNPIDIEKVVEGHQLVARALIVGQGRFQAAMLIEPHWEELPRGYNEKSVIEEIWPVVQNANTIAPKHGQLLKTKIGLASRGKPFKTTPKGSVQRQPTIRDYAEEIEAIYGRIDEEYIGDIPEDFTMENCTAYVQQVLLHLLQVEQVPVTADVFSLGLDSLQTMQLSKILQGALRSRQLDSNPLPIITTQKLYLCPSIAQLSSYLYSLANGGEPSMKTQATESASNRREKITALVEKYTKGLPVKQARYFERSDEYTVVLTGTTGSLGSYILKELILDPQVAKIYCLNRSHDAEQRQVQSFEDKGLGPLGKPSSRLEFLQAKLGAEKLGLSDQKYEELKASVDTVIHNSWKVNFNHNVETFEDTHIEGVRRLIDFSLESTHGAQIHFISSISTIGGWTAANGGSVPEVGLEDPDVSLPQGYGESKFVAERICAVASARCRISTSVYRVGQIAGPTTHKGVWNKQEWLPAMIATSKTIRKVPKTIGAIPVDWIPVDTLAKVIIDIMHSRRKTETAELAAVFNLVNPTSTPWSSLILPIQNRYPVEQVDFGAWLNVLEAFTSPTQTDLQDKPALKILDFFRTLNRGGGNDSPIIPIQTTHAQDASMTMRTLGPVNSALMEKWLEQWNF